MVPYRGYADFFFQLNLLPPYSLRSQGDEKGWENADYRLQPGKWSWVVQIQPGRGQHTVQGDQCRLEANIFFPGEANVAEVYVCYPPAIFSCTVPIQLLLYERN